MFRRRLALLLLLLATPARAADGNRLTYLDGADPYYVSRTFPKLVTPQWVGEDGVEAVVILAIDDMRGHEKWEAFLRPILERLKKIDGRAPVSIMTCQIKPDEPHLQKWLQEGLSLETHTVDHPRPLLQRGDLARGRDTYERCVDMLAAVPHSRPVAFRMPYCDSLNSFSPRFVTEIFNKTTAKGNFLTIDSSVFNVLTANDPDLPRDLVLDPDGQQRFGKYVPHDRSFANTIEDYPYPYVIDRTCWEFPCATPSDWQAQYRNQPNSPVTVRDWEAALDAVVIKQGVLDLVFHPHGWIKSEQLVAFIDHAVAKHGKKVKFLTFREAQQRLDKNLLGGQPLRDPKTGQYNGVRLLDVDNDGYLDVVIGNDQVKQTRVWRPNSRSWAVTNFPVPLVVEIGDGRRETGGRFGVIRPDGHATFLTRHNGAQGTWHFDGERWAADKELLRGLEIDKAPVLTNSRQGHDRGVRLRDLDDDGVCELLVGNPDQSAVFAWSADKKTWTKLPFALPAGTAIVDAEGRDRGLRFVDVDEDGHDDILFSNEERYSLHLFSSMAKGWDRQALAGKRSDPGALPMIARKGSNNGAWFHDRQLWVQNEDTDLLKDLVDRRSFNDMLVSIDPGAKSAAASLHSLRARPGFVVEQVAAEPLLQSPIAFAWGPDGKLWVVEMGDYPLGLDGKGKPGGRVKYLECTHGDGVYDKATVFLDNLSFPTGVLPWRKGVLVTCAPDILYAEDTKGTGKADRREVLYTGFVEGNPQHRVNTLAWGLDNWIHCANGDSGGKIKSVRPLTPDPSPPRGEGGSKVIDIRGRDLRIHPDDGGLEAESGQTQYGRSRDDWGNWFGGNNSNPMYHFVLDDHYQRRNPHVAAPDARVQVSVTPGTARVYPVSRTLPRFNDPLGANRFTSACSPIVYRDDLFGPGFNNSCFVSEPVHNLVHREIIAPDGFTFKSRRADDEMQSEFLASSDNWFRPTMIQTGPDGALWVADMYRQVIEHPQWIPLDWQKRLDLRAGQDRGRMYRVYPVGAKPRAIPRLDKLDTAGLVAALDSPNGWQRDTAQQMLLWRQDKAAIPLLEKLAADSKRPEARLHALCTLDGLGALDAATLSKALIDAHPGVRRQAVRLCEGRLASAPDLGTALLKLVVDPVAPVRLQLAYTLGEWDDARAGAALGKLLVQDGGDRYFAAAALSSVNKKNLDAVLLAVLQGGKDSAATAPLIEKLLGLASALSHDRATVTLLNAVATPQKGRFAPWQFTALTGLLDSLDQRNTSLAQLGKEGNEEMKAALQGLAPLFAAARAAVVDPKTPQDNRLQALRLLGRGLDQQQEDVALLAGLLVPQTPEDVQAAAVAALGRLRNDRVPEVLLRGWKGYGPGLRGQALDVLLRRDDWSKAVLDAVERKQVLPFEIDAPRRQRLLEHRDAGVRGRAGKLFAGAVAPDRQKVIDAYQEALTLKGDAARGKAVFGKSCTSCHRLDGAGNEVGPDLAALASKPADYLLIAILDPNRAVEARYINYLAETKNGLTFSGVLAAETGNSVTLIGTDGKPKVILRTDLESLTSTGKSAMPDGLEKDVKPQDMADLLAYLRAHAPVLKRKEFAGNKPEVVRPGDDGVLRLWSSNCEIYGKTLVMEKQYGNLGYWQSEDDQAVWTVEVPQTGVYTVSLDWACDAGSAGNAFVLEAGGKSLTGKVASTGSWDTYKQAKVGEIELQAGRQRLTFRSMGKIAGALTDLRGIRLVPAK
jgi:putative membrane-bound dehydrogenase-like protein